MLNVCNNVWNREARLLGRVDRMSVSVTHEQVLVRCDA